MKKLEIIVLSKGIHKNLKKENKKLKPNTNVFILRREIVPSTLEKTEAEIVSDLSE